MRVLTRAFERTLELGGARKAVIFTESVRTQTWLAELLLQNGYKNEIVLLNGSNNDPLSKQIYNDWLEQHRGSGKISGSKTSDMKAALVDKFRNDATLMICTEAGAEGINLQFCSLLINYDLPWNPQRVEQRIGRVHRYGQKNDVVVVNFINKGNRADERVFELLSQKFQLFEGVFGASDEVLGSIESGVDIERRIHEIYQRCRSDEQIESEFNELQDELRDQLEEKADDTRKSLLENFDADVVSRLNMRRGQVETLLSNYQQRLRLLARMMLQQNDGMFNETDAGFIWNESHYSLNWQQADHDDQLFFRPNTGLGEKLIKQAKSAESLPEVELNFVYQTENGQWADVKNLIDKQGIIKVTKVKIGSTEETREHLLLSSVTDDGIDVHPETVERLLQLPVATMPKASVFEAPAIIDELQNQQLMAFKTVVEQDNELYYSLEEEKLERWAEDRRVALDIRIKQLDQEIKEARKAARQLATLQEKMTAKKQLKQLERERDDVMLSYHEEKKKIEQEEDRLLEEIEARLAMDTQIIPLFTIRWQLNLPTEGNRL